MPELAAESSAPPARRLRFSLRSLLLATILIASATTLWLHREPWTLERTLTLGSDERPFEMAISFDGRRFVTKQEGCAVVRDVFTGERQVKLEGPRKYSVLNHVAFSPDGRRIAYTNQEGEALVFDAVTGQQISTFEAHEDRVYEVSFSPDGKSVLTCSGDSTARLWDPETACELRKFEGHQSGVLSTAFSPDGTRVITLSLDGNAIVWDAATGKQIGFVGKDLGCGSIKYSPDGRRILILQESFELVLMDALTFQKVATWERPYIVSTATFFPDNRRLLITGYNLGANDLHCEILDTTNGYILFSMPGTIRGAITPDGSRMITQTGFGMFSNNNYRLHLWHRRHPEYWWGILTLPEFWLTTLFCIALLVTLARDRQIKIRG